jgi:hypothetical protein
VSDPPIPAEEPNVIVSEATKAIEIVDAKINTTSAIRLTLRKKITTSALSYRIHQFLLRSHSLTSLLFVSSTRMKT